MNQQPIYELSIQPYPALPDQRRRDASVVYFSNLKKTVEFLLTTLNIHGWEPQVSYSTIYRNLQLRDKFWQDYEVSGVKFFRVVISKQILNPVLPAVEMEDYPRKPRR
ncbi:hypothetical protein BWI93_22485 [Siphonobacter sp. BAB-5385]|uniref:hypothetical protein n=1 Tax=unclassified Siphonobacter TaxID=2635712 RepID=UPI000B9E278C|nr:MULTISPECIES: hypothetical protein [unclassified Siphonobacter]OZI06050.1 hypothetical protein BWI93_22485 [Siphonobacter sp. BAB-5385]PMD97286.1 hypothetical protein BWI97_06520 [Siphonobacter sp. BAB-5405]